ncbi:MAG: hypothetical protein RIQ71_661 [Verrucomicrobiota bacterium]
MENSGHKIFQTSVRIETERLSSARDVGFGVKNFAGTQTLVNRWPATGKFLGHYIRKFSDAHGPARADIEGAAGNGAGILGRGGEVRCSHIVHVNKITTLRSVTINSTRFSLARAGQKFGDNPGVR